MRRNLGFLGSAFLILTLQAAAQEKPAADDFKFTSGQSVYVIAVKSPAKPGIETWEKLNRNMPKPPNHHQTHASSFGNDPLGRQTLEREIKERPLLEKSQSERTTLDRTEPIRRVLPPPDPELKQLVEEEFRKQKKFKLADSPETADFIFFANGQYIYTISATGNQGRSSGMISIAGGQGDSSLALNTLAKLSLAAIPASDYHQWQSDIPNLFEKAKWQEEVWGEFRRDRETRYTAPSAKNLVQQFHKHAVKK